MPFSWANIAGLGPDALRAARAQHPVFLTGTCLVLETVVPEFIAIAHANNSREYTFRQIYWLFMGVIHPGDDIPPAQLFYCCMIHVARLGTAFEDMLANGLDTTPCTPSVARARFRATGRERFSINPAPYIALAADLYPLEIPPAIAVPAGVAAVAAPGAGGAVGAHRQEGEERRRLLLRLRALLLPLQWRLHIAYSSHSWITETRSWI